MNVFTNSRLFWLSPLNKILIKKLAWYCKRIKLFYSTIYSLSLFFFKLFCFADFLKTFPYTTRSQVVNWICLVKTSMYNKSYLLAFNLINECPKFQKRTQLEKKMTHTQKLFSLFLSGPWQVSFLLYFTIKNFNFASHVLFFSLSGGQPPSRKKQNYFFRQM